MRNTLRFLALSFAILLGLAACGNSAASTTAKPLTASDILSNAQGAKVQSFEFTISATSKDLTLAGKGQATAAPYRMAMDLNTTVSGVDITVSMVEDDQYDYNKDPLTGMWSKSPSTSSSLKSGITNYDLKNPTLIGKETIGGVETYHLTGTDSSGSPQDFWFRTDNFYLMQGTFTSSSGSSPMNGKLTITGWNTNPTITIPDVAS